MSLGLATANKPSTLHFTEDIIHLEMRKHINAQFLEVNRAFNCHHKKIIDLICTTMLKILNIYNRTAAPHQ